MWTTAEQTDFFYANIDQYFTYQREGRLIHFWPRIYREWCERWPDIGEAAPSGEGAETAEANADAATTGSTTPAATDTATPVTAETATPVTTETATPATAEATTPATAEATTPATAEATTTSADEAAGAAPTNSGEIATPTPASTPPAAEASTVVAVKRRAPPSLMDRIKQWFSNRRGARSEVPARKRITLPLNGKGTRKPLIHQIYQRLYLDKITPIVSQRYALYIHTIPAGEKPQPLIAFRNKLAKELLDAETQEVRDHVYNKWKGSKGRLDNTRTIKAELKDEELTDAEKHQMQLAYYENNIGNLKATLQTVLRDIYLQTGWVMHIQGGGRRPGRNGAVQCISAHTRLPDGRNFANHNVDYMDAVQKPFGDWIVSLFPPKEQAHYRLTKPGILLGVQDDSAQVQSLQEKGAMVGGVEHLESIIVDALARTDDEDMAPTTATKRSKPKPRPTKSKRAAATQARPRSRSRSRSRTPPPTYPKNSIAAMSKKPAQRPDTDEDSDADDEWQNVDFDSLDQPTASASEPQPQPQSSIEKPIGTPYEQAVRARAEQNRQLLLSITQRARQQLGMPPSSQKTPQPPVVNVQPSDRMSRSKSREDVSSRSTSTARSEPETEFDTDFDALIVDNDKDAIATYNTISSDIDTDIFPVWDSIIDKAKTLERVLGYPASSDAKHRFSSKDCPPEVAAWIKRHRILEKAPGVDDVDLFISQMQDWYVAAQPAGRGDTLPLAQDLLDAQEWARLIRGGANGWQIFLIALTWWSDLIEGEAGEKLFESMLADVDWVLSRVLDAARGRAGSKREAPGGSSPNAKRARAG